MKDGAMAPRGVLMGTNNSPYGGRTEGPYPNSDFTWEKKQIANIGFDVTLLKNLNATIDLFSERTHRHSRSSCWHSGTIPAFYLRNTNSGEAVNKGLEVALQYRTKVKSNFEYYAGGTLCLCPQ